MWYSLRGLAAFWLEERWQIIKACDEKGKKEEKKQEDMGYKFTQLEVENTVLKGSGMY
jgi:hypothetical protein